MSRRLRNLALCGASLTVIACVTTAVFVTRASIDTSPPAKQHVAPNRNFKTSARLLRQPEAARLSQRLGKRFGPSLAASVLTGKLTVDGKERPIVMTRRQAETGENVNLQLAGASAALYWRAERGAKAASNATDKEALFLERLSFDSPDYFVLAQLRGASYYTVARLVRPDNAPDNYDGPLWTVVRVEEPPSEEQNTQQVSRWRLFYINSSTGLIDKIVSEEQGQPIEANFSDWTEQSGEKFPATITWTNQGQTVMTLNLTNLSTAAH